MVTPIVEILLRDETQKRSLPIGSDPCEVGDERRSGQSPPPDDRMLLDKEIGVNAFFPIKVSIFLNHDAFDTKRPFQTLKRLKPKPRLRSFGRIFGVWRTLSLPPDAQHARMQQADTMAAIELIQTTNNVVGIAWAHQADAPPAGSLAARKQRSDRPMPRLLGAPKWCCTRHASAFRAALCN